jgi:hypothetical protein
MVNSDIIPRLPTRGFSQEDIHIQKRQPHKITSLEFMKHEIIGGEFNVWKFRLFPISESGLAPLSNYISSIKVSPELGPGMSPLIRERDSSFNSPNRNSHKSHRPGNTICR